MAKRLTTEDHLTLLRQLRATSGDTQNVAALTRLLAEPRLHGIIVKGAAELAERFAAKNLTDPLAACIRELMKDPKRDPGCEGKTAALQTLIAWDANLPDLFLDAARYQQMEPVFGGSKDTAAEFRGLAALGVAATRPLGAIEILVDLLVDPEKNARARTAMALGRWRGAEALPVLRLKARVGDEDPEVIGEVLASLLQHDPRGQLEFVAQFLHHKIPGLVEAAALALGQSKVEGAMPALAAAWPALRGSSVATTFLMAVSLLRTEEAVEWLLARLRESRTKEALAILDALALFRTDPRTVARIQELVATREELTAAFAEIFAHR